MNIQQLKTNLQIQSQAYRSTQYQCNRVLRQTQNKIQGGASGNLQGLKLNNLSNKNSHALKVAEAERIPAETEVFKINKDSIKSFPSEIKTPTYDRSKTGTNWVHIGLGNFHRAHQAVYADDLLDKLGPSEWGICGIGLLPGDSLVNNILERQDFLYSVIERSPEEDNARIVGSIQKFIHAVDNSEEALEKLASADTKLVSLTITEKGYHTNDFGDLDFQDLEVKHDLENYLTKPIGTYGYLTASLRRRMDRGLLPYTIMSCDNVSHNGDIIKKALLQFVKQVDVELYDWLTTKGAFPNTMVDRITPAFSKSTQTFVQDKFNIEDGWPIQTEFFRQWVIEDEFCQDRPKFEEVGVQVVKDVFPYEKLKLHILNLSHSAVAYYGVLTGYEYVHDAVQDPLLKLLLKEIMDDEVSPCLLPVPGVNEEEYKQVIIQRFSNKQISDTLLRITMDGVGKIPKFVVPPLLEALEQGRECRGLIFVIASWFRFLQGVTETGEEYKINDPYGSKLQRLAQLGGKDAFALMKFKVAFGDNLTQNKTYRKLLKDILYDFYEVGAQETLEKILRETGHLPQKDD